MLPPVPSQQVDQSRQVLIAGHFILSVPTRRKLGPYARHYAPIEIIVVDAYGDDEQYTAFLTVISEQAPLPAEATLLGVPVAVTGIDYYNEARGLTATCRSPEGTLAAGHPNGRPALKQRTALPVRGSIPLKE